MKLTLAIATVLITSSFQPAAAGLIDECRGGGWPDARLSACTQIIMSPGFGPEARAFAYRSRGEAHNEAGAFREALADFNEAIRFGMHDPLALAGRGWAKFSTQDFGGAIRDYDDAIQLYPGVANFYVERGHVYLVIGNPPASVRDLTKAIELDPGNAVAYNNRGLAFRKKGELDAAFRDYTTAVQLNPVYALAYANRGHLQEARGRKNAAVDDLRHALLLDPSLVDARNALKRMGDAHSIANETDRRIRDGEALAENICSPCHAVGVQGASSNRRAPEFRNIRQLNTLLALRKPITRGIAAPHDQMPPSLLSHEQIDAIIAYINSISTSR